MANRYLYIVARTQPGLYEEIADRFADDPKVTVIFDRRDDERKAAVTAAQRRMRDRRRNDEVQEWLRDRSYAVVTVPA